MCGRPAAFRKFALIFLGYSLTGRSPNCFQRVAGRPQAFRTSGGKAEKQEWLLAERIMLSHHRRSRKAAKAERAQSQTCRLPFFVIDRQLLISQQFASPPGLAS